MIIVGKIVHKLAKVQEHIFYQCGTIDHGTHIPGPISQSSTESELNVACNSGI